MKKLLAFVPWLVCLLLVVGTVLFVASKQHAAAGKYEAERQKGCAQSFPAPWEAEQQEACKHERDSSVNYLPWWYVLVAWPEGITVWAIIGTGFVIAWQSNETRRAAKSAESQIMLQSAALRQWVNVVPLGLSIPPTLKNPCEIALRFEIVNKTDYLVTIKGVEFELIANVHDIRKVKVDCDFPLPPRKSENESAFPFTGTCVIDVGEFNESGRIFIVSGDIGFLDCMDRKQVQPFQDLYRGFIDGRLERMKPSSISNDPEQHQKAT